MKKKGAACAADILGLNRPARKVVKSSATVLCFVCLKEIGAERLAALVQLNIPRDEWSHTACSTTEKKKGIFLGEVGTSQLLVVDKVYKDSMRDMFALPAEPEEQE